VKVEGDEGLEEAVVEQEVDGVFLLPCRDPVLATDEAEPVAQLQQELLKPGNQAGLELTLPDGPADPEEFQAVGALDHLVGLLGKVLRKREAEVVGFLVGDRALVGAGLDLVEQDVARPPEAGGGMEIPEAGRGIGNLVENDQVLAPWDFCDELSQKFDGCRALGF